MFKCVLQQTIQLQFSADIFTGNNYRDVIATLFQHENETSDNPQHVIDLSPYLIVNLNKNTMRLSLFIRYSFTCIILEFVSF